MSTMGPSDSGVPRRATRANPLRLLLPSAALILLAGCASYLTPGGPASLRDLDAATDTSRQPAPGFPARLAVVRVQAPRYRSASSHGIGAGSFSVVDSAELLSAQSLQAIAGWPQVEQVSTLDSRLLPDQFESLDDLRLAAAKVPADVLLVYTVDTRFTLQGKASDPGASVSLGKPPADTDAIDAKASVLFVDVRTGFAYGQAEAAARSIGLADIGKSRETLDAKRLSTERQAFAALAVTAEQTWAGIEQRYR